MSGVAISRREFIGLLGASAAVTGCATNPVTGKSQLMFFSEQQEIAWDTQMAPHQFSAHYGAIQDKQLNDYVIAVGSGLVPHSHRPNMPYNFRVVNSPVVNGYTFPAGSMALARGLMLEMQSEAQLAAVLGHEVGHVAARHTGSRMSWAMLTQIGVVVLAAYLEEEKQKYAAIGAGLGMIGANMLLSRYSRADERQADSLGLQYMTSASYDPEGMAGLMQIFMNLHKGRPNVVELLFATHPMSDERHGNAKKELAAKYAGGTWKEGRERYLDSTKNLRRIGDAIRQMQEGETELMEGKLGKAEAHFKAALKTAPDDYAGLLLMTKVLHAQNKNREAEQYALQARQVYPEEAQALFIAGIVQVDNRKYGEAYANFDEYEKVLPGNPNTIYFKGLSLDRQGRRKDAVDYYLKYLESSPAGDFSENVKQTLRSWGYAIPGETVQS